MGRARCTPSWWRNAAWANWIPHKLDSRPAGFGCASQIAIHFKRTRERVIKMSQMMEEILQQPAALGGVRKFYASPGAIPEKALRKLVTHWPPTVVFTGMGSSLFA